MQQGPRVVLDENADEPFHGTGLIARCSITGTRRALSSAIYSADNPGMEKSTCMVPHCQERPMLSFRWYSILGP